jgi:hypothetical protein
MIIRDIHDQIRDQILERWKNGESINWRSLTLKGRIAYVQACLFWTGLPTKTIKSGSYVINCSWIKNRVDLFCILGEVFFGERGYFGQDLDGFSDCFSEIHLHNRQIPVVEPNAVITIIDSERLQRVLNKRNIESYFYFLEILGKHGFEVKFK